MYNIFEEIILPEHFEASDIKSKMIDGGAISSMMSGSGPSVFGVFDNEKDALKVVEELTGLGYSSYLCRPIK